METKDIKMKIISRRYDVKGSLFDAIAEEIEEELGFEFDDGEDAEEEEIALNTEGKMNIDGENIEIVYEESEITGMEGSRTSLHFSSDDPGFVSMLRSGNVSTSLVFERGKRHHCIYNTPIMPFEICVRTYKVENTLLEDGRLSLDYMIEIRGACAERTKFELQIVE